MCYTQTHGVPFQNELLKDPIRPYWEGWLKRGAEAYKKWFDFWLRKAERTEEMVYFFRFEDVIANPSKEITEIMRFVLGMESVENTVLEHRIKEVLNWDP